VTVNALTGFVSGAPSKPGTFAVTITGTNAAKVSVPYKFTLIAVLPIYSGGGYAGLIDRHATLNGGFGGVATLSITTTGGVTGSLRMGAASWPVSGSLFMDTTGGGRLTTTVLRKGLTSLLLNLTFDPGRNFGYAEGTVADATTPTNTAAVRVWCNRWSSTNLSTAFAGYFTSEIKLPDDQIGNVAVPQGSGFLKLTVGTTGSVSLANICSLFAKSITFSSFSVFRFTMDSVA
jgi:hypothetical protein